MELAEGGHQRREAVAPRVTYARRGRLVSSCARERRRRAHEVRVRDERAGQARLEQRQLRVGRGQRDDARHVRGRRGGPHELRERLKKVVAHADADRGRAACGRARAKRSRPMRTPRATLRRDHGPAGERLPRRRRPVAPGALRLVAAGRLLHDAHRARLVRPGDVLARHRAVRVRAPRRLIPERHAARARERLGGLLIDSLRQRGRGTHGLLATRRQQRPSILPPCAAANQQCWSSPDNAAASLLAPEKAVQSYINI